jgi:hypothetical protein
MNWLSITCLTVLVGSGSGEELSLEARTREAVELSVPYIEAQGASWIEGKKCVSCHRVNTMLWSLGAARKAGISVDPQIAETWEWAIANSLEKNDDGKMAVSGNKEGVAQLVLAQKKYFEEVRTDELQDAFRRALKEDITEQGLWLAGGQLPSQKRSKTETDLVSTDWLTLAATEIGGVDFKEGSLSSLPQSWTQESTFQSTEGYVARLLVAFAFQEQDRVDQLRSELLKRQHPDGGWGWLVDDESDALGTGLALYGLMSTGSKTDHDSIHRGQVFLLESQGEDGSWEVKGTKTKKKDKVEETAVYWGTNWAVIALSEILKSNLSP